MTVGEAPGMTPDIALEFIKEGDKQDLNMMFHFQHMEADCIGNACVHTGFKLKNSKSHVDVAGQNVRRRVERKLYGKPRPTSFGFPFRRRKRYHDLSAKVLANSYFFLSGTPFVYQGQEIGMTSIYLKTCAITWTLRRSARTT